MQKRKRLRRWLYGLALLCAAVAVLYWRAANPTRLRAVLTSALAEYGAEVHHIDDIGFTPWGGLTFSGLEVVLDPQRAPHPTGPIAPTTPGGQTRVIAPFGRIDLDWAALLAGDTQPTAIFLHGPTVHLAGAPDQVVWDAQPAETESPWLPAPPDLPRIEIESADVRVAGRDGAAARRWLLSISGDYEGVGAARHYVAKLVQVGGAALRGPSFLGNRPLIEAAWGPDDASVALAPVSLTAALAPAPAALRDAIDACELQGELSVERVEVDASGLRRARLRLLNAAGVAPIEVDATSRFLRFRESVVTVDAQRSPSADELEVSLEIRGEINGAEATATWRSTGAPADLWSRVRAGDVESMLGKQIIWGFEARGISLPDPADKAFVESPRLPKPVRDFLRDYLPRGRGDLRGRGVTERGADGQWSTRFDGEMDAESAETRYFRFPYLIDHVQGLAMFSENGVRFDGLGGRHGPGHIWVRGAINNYKPWTGLDLVFQARNLPMNDDLYRALPAGYRPIWEAAKPTGVADATVRLWREDGEPGSPREIETDVDARLISASLSLAGTRLTDASGRVSVRDGRIQLADLRGFSDGAEISVDGDIDLRDERGAGVAVRVLIAGYPIDTAESNLLPASSPRLVGVADVHGEVTGSLNALVATYIARVTDGELTGFTKGPPWTQAHGMLFISDEEIEVRDLEATRSTGNVRISGQFNRTDGELRPVSITLTADDRELGVLLGQMIPTQWARLRDALGLAGPGRVSIALSALRPGGELDQGQFDIRADRMRPGPAPLALRNVSGLVTVHDTTFELVEARAAYGDSGVIRASGGGDFGKSDGWSNFTLQAESIDIGQAFIDAMPTALRDILRRVALSGRIDAAFDRIRLNSAAAGMWDVRGRLSFADAAMELGLPLRGVAGRLEGEAKSQPNGGLALQGEFVADRGTLDGRVFERLEGTFKKSADTAWTRLDDLRVRLCDGEAFGFARFNADSGEYELNLTLHDMRLAQLFPEDDDQQPNRPGRVDGQVFLRGSGEIATRRGGGELRIRDASLLGTRVMRSVAEAQGGRRNAVDEPLEVATMQFAWEGQRLRFSNLDIRGASTRFVGEGEWDLTDDAIRMTLFAVGGGPGDPLSKLLNAAGREIMQYDVTGSMAQPRVTARPLRNITEPIRRLLSGG